jgi:hypothetical protein
MASPTSASSKNTSLDMKKSRPLSYNKSGSNHSFVNLAKLHQIGKRNANESLYMSSSTSNKVIYIAAAVLVLSIIFTILFAIYYVAVNPLGAGASSDMDAPAISSSSKTSSLLLTNMQTIISNAASALVQSNAAFTHSASHKGTEHDDSGDGAAFVQHSNDITPPAPTTKTSATHANTDSSKLIKLKVSSASSTPASSTHGWKSQNGNPRKDTTPMHETKYRKEMDNNASDNSFLQTQKQHVANDSPSTSGFKSFATALTQAFAAD